MNQTIWMFWYQGWQDAPDICKQCVESWKYNNPEWEVKALDSESIIDYIPNVYNQYSKLQISKAHLADIIRITLLNKFGGVWSDATVYCNKPLDDWLPEETFFFEKKPYDISNWFISKGKDDYIIKQMYKSTVEYWKDRKKPHEYFWFHSLFKGRCETDKKFKSIWDDSPHISARGPHLFVPYNKKFTSEYEWKETFDEVKEQLDSKIDPVYKLTWRLYPEENTPGDYLLNSKKGVLSC